MLLHPEQRISGRGALWNAKSGSVSRILETWNIAADSVIFVDDSPMELAEVAAAIRALNVFYSQGRLRGRPSDVAAFTGRVRQGTGFLRRCPAT